MKKPLIERFQKLAGIKPLYELSPETMASAAVKAREKGRFSQERTFDQGVLDKLASDLEGKTLANGNLKVDSVDVDHPKDFTIDSETGQHSTDERGAIEYDVDSTIKIYVSVPKERVGGFLGIGGSDEYTGDYNPDRATDPELEKIATDRAQYDADVDAASATGDKTAGDKFERDADIDTFGMIKYHAKEDKFTLEPKEFWDRAGQGTGEYSAGYAFMSSEDLKWLQELVRAYNPASDFGNMTDTNMQSVGEKYNLILPVGDKNYQEVPGAITREGINSLNKIKQTIAESLRKIKRK